MSRSCESVPGVSRSPGTGLARLLPDSVTRSAVAGVDRGNLTQPPSSGPAIALVLNHTSCAVIHTCEYFAGVLQVTDTSVRVEQPTTAQHRPATETTSATGVRFMVPIPVPS